ncbi:MAG: triphosphoribosyl-dephospho-CoA synthase, partial [Rhodospirillaceae bacterium]|nr:triphosphoribosyl-dephospho-CoA synthase [Rhodospirillaceae bacterium]
AYVAACLAELRALKPGNVHAFADGHRMTVADFEASARASAPAIADPALPVGRRIRVAVERTRAAVGTNTNLGIVLLCAPLAAAAQRPAPLRAAVEAALAALDVADAEEAFAAIRLAAPAGLGDSPTHDVRRPARGTLLEAMRAARDRDRIAAQYADGFRDVFEFGVPRLRQGLARWNDPAWAASAAYLGFLARFPDSHVARKHGVARAEAVRRAAAPLEAALMAQADPALMRARLLRFDATLKSKGVNPGTSADLTVASLFALALEGAPHRDG